MDSLVIPIEQIQEPRERFERPLTRAFLTSVFEEVPAYTVVAPATLVAHLTRIGETDVLVEGHTEVSVESACRRCLKTVQSEVPVVFTIDLVAQRKSGAGKRAADDSGEGASSASFDDRDADREPFDGERIDLRPLVREQLLLGLPSIEPVCQESCRGLCATCGQDLNEADCGHSPKGTDPRWAVLRDLKV